MKCAFEMLNDIVALRLEDEAKREQERLEEIRREQERERERLEEIKRKREREAYIQNCSNKNKEKLFNKIASDLLDSRTTNTTLDLAVFYSSYSNKTLVALSVRHYYANGKLDNVLYCNYEDNWFFLEDVVNDLTKMCYKVSVENYSEKVYGYSVKNRYHMAPMVKLTVSIDPQCIAMIK